MRQVLEAIIDGKKYGELVHSLIISDKLVLPAPLLLAYPRVVELTPFPLGSGAGVLLSAKIELWQILA